MTEQGGQPVYEFDGFRLDVNGRRVYGGDGKPIALSSRVFDTLVCLIQHRGELLSKATLMQAVWPDTVVEENNLNQAITALRKALGESPGDHRFIVTEPGRGYRFVADVSASIGPAAAGGPALRRRRVGAGIAVAVVVALAIGYAGLRQYVATVDRETQAPVSENSKPSVIPHSVAVLPFENLSPDPDDAYFAAGIHDEIINRLAGIRDLNVIARTSVMQYAGTARPITEIAKELHVESVMEGTVRYADQQVRITAQLIDGNTGTELWSGAYSRELTHIFSIQAEIANSISAALETEIAPSQVARLKDMPTRSSAAYALYLKAVNLANSGHVFEAEDPLRRAIELDRDFAEAYALRGAIAASQMIVNSEVAIPNDAETPRLMGRQAVGDIEKALALDPDCGIAWQAKGFIEEMHWRWPEADAAFARALELRPNEPEAYALFKVLSHDTADAIRLARRNVELNPNSFWSYYNLSQVALLSGQQTSDPQDSERLNSASTAAAMRANELRPGHPGVVAMLAYSRLSAGDEVAGERYLQTAEQLLTPEMGQFAAGIVYANGRFGFDAAAARVFKFYVSWAHTHRAGDGDWALAYLGVRDADKAIEWLSRGVERAESQTPDAGFYALMVIRGNGWDDPILEQPRFRKLRDRLSAITRLR